MSIENTTAPLLLDGPAVAKLLGCSDRHVHELAMHHGLPSLKLGALRKYRRVDVEAWIERNIKTGTATLTEASA